MPSADDFDFWLGTWDASWGETGKESGRNVITRSFGGRVVEERFDGRPGVDLLGMSVSVFDPHRELWRQTWVDDAGNYFRARGQARRRRGAPALRAPQRLEADAIYRMRFFDITRDSLTGTWSARSTVARASRSSGASSTSAPDDPRLASSHRE